MPLSGLIFILCLYKYGIPIVANNRVREETHRTVNLNPHPAYSLSLSVCVCALLQSILLDSTCSSPNPSLIKLSFAETEVPYDLVAVGLLQKPSAA